MADFAVIGAGRMGAAFCARLTGLGHSVIIGSRNPDSDAMQETLAGIDGSCTVSSIADAAEQGNVVILTVPYSALTETLGAMGELDGKIVIDVANALTMGPDGNMTMASDTSAAEELQAAKPGAKVVKAFNTIGFHMIRQPDLLGGPVSTMLAGADADAKARVAAIAGNLGFEAVDVGPLRLARYIEGMSALYLAPYLQGRKDSAFEYYLRTGASPKESSGVRAAG